MESKYLRYQGEDSKYRNHLNNMQIYRKGATDNNNMEEETFNFNP